jgi:tRNA(fMet)-specific endonuclease VapC
LTPRYLLDTDTFIHLRQRRSPDTLVRFERLESGEAGVSVVSYGELIYGAEKSVHREEVLQILAELVALIPVLPMPPKAGEIYGILRRALEQKGQMIGSNDLWIAAHARVTGMVLVTSNEREFRRVPGLTIENWTR